MSECHLDTVEVSVLILYPLKILYVKCVRSNSKLVIVINIWINVILLEKNNVNCTSAYQIVLAWITALQVRPGLVITSVTQSPVLKSVFCDLNFFLTVNRPAFSSLQIPFYCFLTGNLGQVGLAL